MHRHITGLSVGLLALFGFALPAFANTTNLSSDPSYAQGPFISYCKPYTSTFIEGRHYKPQTSTPCAFSVPTAVGGSNRAIGIYKGVPGASTVVGGETFFGNPTLVQEDVVNFGSPAQDQEFFSVIFGGNSAADIAQFNAAFTTGSSTNTLLPSDNYRMIRWKWGGKPVSEYNPLIIIPDFTNSWVTDTGAVIDPIFKSYQNLTDTLVANGYIVNQTLFTLPYDWQESITTTAQALAAKIASIKSTCGCSQVDIVAHGTGGLVALQHIKSAAYQNDVEQLVTLGTPLLGVPSAYRALEAGQISTGNVLSDGLAQALLAQQAKDGGFNSIFAYIQSKPSSAFREIVPVYTNYLLDSGFNEFFYPSGYPQNTFLEALLTGFNQLIKKTRLTTVLADDQQYQTPAQYVITTSTQPPLWPHGQPVQTLTDAGDGFVPRTSAEAAGLVALEVATSHRTIPTTAQSQVFSFLNNKNPTSVVNNTYPVSCVLFITTSAGTDLLITDPNNLRLGKNFSGSGTFTEITHSLYSGSSAPTEYGVVANPVAGTYQVQTQGTTNGSFTINATDVCGNGMVISTSTTSTITAGQILGFGLSVSSDGSSISITSLDSNAPIVLINSPQQGQTYYQNDVTPLSVSITDPEGSPIASATYQLNNLSVTLGQPLPFSSVPVGTTTVTVTATDIYGNTAVATSTFLLLPPDYTKPKIKITSPLSYGLYTRSDVLYLTSTITANAALATSSYWYDSKRINPALPLPLSTASIGGHTVMVAATDVRGNSATSTLRFLVVGAKNSCIADIVAVLTDIRNKEYPDKPTIAQLLKNCAALLKNIHRNDDRRDDDDDDHGHH